MIDAMTFKYGGEVNTKAALRIQAGFRAWKVRKRTLPRLKARMQAGNYIATVMGKHFRARLKR